MSAQAEVLPLAEVVRDLHFDRSTGILALAGGGRQASLYVHAGTVFYCKSDAAAHRLDRVLVKWGLVEEAAVAGLVQRAGRDVRGGLVREGVFPTAAAFDDFMAQVLRERMVDLFAVSGLVATFHDEDVSELHEVPFPTTTPNLILEGVRRMADGERHLAPLLEDDAPLSLNPQPSVPLESLAMGPTEGYVISQLNGTTSPSDVAAVSPLGPAQTVRLLYGLLVLDVARHPSFAGYRFQVGELGRRRARSSAVEGAERERIQAEYARVRRVDAFQVIDGAGSLPLDELREAVKRYQEEWKPERFTERVAKDLREQLIVIAGRAGEVLLGAIETSQRRHVASTSSGGAETDATAGDDAFRPRRLELTKSHAQEKVDVASASAAEMHGRALEAIKKKDWHSAIQLLTEVNRLHESAETQALLGSCLEQNPHWGKRAEAAYLRAMKLDQFNPGLPLVLGRMYLAHGLKDRAREQFARALELQPDHEEARQALKDLKRR